MHSHYSDVITGLEQAKAEERIAELLPRGARSRASFWLKRGELFARDGAKPRQCNLIRRQQRGNGEDMELLGTQSPERKGKGAFEQLLLVAHGHFARVGEAFACGEEIMAEAFRVGGDVAGGGVAAEIYGGSFHREGESVEEVDEFIRGGFVAGTGEARLRLVRADKREGVGAGKFVHRHKSVVVGRTSELRGTKARGCEEMDVALRRQAHEHNRGRAIRNG